MNEFFSSIKADLLDRRLLPIVAVVGVALLAALAYVVLAGGSGSSSQPVPPAPAQVAKGIAVTAAGTSPSQPVAETTSGSPVQRHGAARDPFQPLASAAASKSAGASATPAGASGSSTAASTGSPSSSSATSTGSSPAPEGSSPKGESKPAAPAPSAPSKPQKQTVYHVSVVFGALPAVPPPGGLQLTPYNDLKLLTALPSSKQPLLVFRGVTAGGKSATFTIAGETILRGAATCVPSPAQCQEINLKPGQAEQLEYIPASGAPVTYEVRVVKVTPAKASGAAVVKIRQGASAAGRALLRSLGMLDIPGMRFTSSVGVLAFAGPPAKGARARASTHRHL